MPHRLGQLAEVAVDGRENKVLQSEQPGVAVHGQFQRLIPAVSLDVEHLLRARALVAQPRNPSPELGTGLLLRKWVQWNKQIPRPDEGHRDSE